MRSSRTAALVFDDDRVHGSVYTDMALFEKEIERIFHGWWVYVGHESEIPESGDYRRKWIGRQPVILVRTRDGGVSVLFNRCRHRGAIVCNHEAGNANVFRCAYHGWTYRNDGSLLGVPFPRAYGEDFAKETLGLSPVASLGIYRGFVFASLSSDVPSFQEYLSPAMPYIDWFVDASPLGSIELSAGVMRSHYYGNWKLIGMDGYHAPFVHRSLQEVVGLTDSARAEALFRNSTEASPARTVDLGRGHVRLDEQHAEEETILLGIQKAEKGATAEYHRLLEEAYPDTSAAITVSRSDPHLGIFPNLHLVGAHVRTIRPVTVGLTEVEAFPAMLAGVPAEINVGRLRAFEWFHGPASFGTPDDADVFARVQTGLQADADPWVLLSRGIDRERVQADGSRFGNITDETTQRGQFREWAAIVGDEYGPGHRKETELESRRV